MQALHASSALAVNVFDYWRERPSEPLARALRIDSPIAEIKFEQQFPTGMQGTPPHLDMTLATADGRLIAIESKFLEPYPARKAPKEFRETYFPATGRWADRALPACQELAEAMRTGRRIFDYLDAQQLLKHVLGLANTLPGTHALWYFWYDPGGEEGTVHRREIDEFSGCVDPNVGFLARSYQEVISGLADNCGDEHSEYVAYLSSRYGQ